MHLIIVRMILKHSNIIMFSLQTSAIKKTLCLIELGNVKVPLVIFKTGMNRNICLEGSGWWFSVVLLSFELPELSLARLFISVSTYVPLILFLCPKPDHTINQWSSTFSAPGTDTPMRI